MRHLLIRRIAFAALAFSIFLTTTEAAKAVRPSLSTPASMMFADRTVATYGVLDLVTSDAYGAYADAVDGVSCVVFTGSTGDAHCDLSTSNNPIRVFNIDPGGYIAGTGTGTGPATAFSSNGGINIQALAQMAIGDTKLTTAVFGTQFGQFQLVNSLNPSTSAVSATRSDAHTWIVSTTGPGAGDIAQLIQPGKGNRSMNAGYYHLPFQITVTCQTCVAP
jgi:hypothetical protein